MTHIGPIRVWQWPNLLGLDAAVIAVCWAAFFAVGREAAAAPGWAAYTVLGLSVWLTYMADRLLDAAAQSMCALLAQRHRFARKYQALLLRVWLAVLVINGLIAFQALSEAQLQRGFVLFLVCLIYTLLNRLLSKYYFPKELFVAVIFTAGTQVFQVPPALDSAVIALGLLCLVNCLMIADQEQEVDALLQVRSAITHVPSPGIGLLLAIILVFELITGPRGAILISAAALAILFAGRHRIPAEIYRVLCDSARLLGPILFFLL